MLMGWTNNKAAHQRSAQHYHLVVTVACYLSLLAASSRNVALTIKL